jgi:preprotein translocase subunit SecE
MMQRQGQVGPDGSPATARKQPPRPNTKAPGTPRTAPAQFVREVRGELRKVAWPTREETMNYAAVVFFTLVLLISLIFVLDLGFAKVVIWLFKK